PACCSSPNSSVRPASETLPASVRLLPRAEASHARPSWSSHFFNPKKEPPPNPLAHALGSNAGTTSKNLRKCHILPLVHIDKQITPSCLDHSLSVPNPNRCGSRSSTLKPELKRSLDRTNEASIHLLQLLARVVATDLVSGIKGKGRNKQHVGLTVR